MSTDATFSRLSFPELNTGAKNFSKVAYTELRSDDEAQERAFEQAKVRGHAAGYTAGMREGAEMMRARQLAMEQDHAGDDGRRPRPRAAGGGRAGCRHPRAGRTRRTGAGRGAEHARGGSHGAGRGRAGP